MAKLHGVKNGNWKGGVHVNNPHTYGTESTTYLRISAGPFRGWYVHELIAWAKLGRPLTPEETVDHLDGDGLNCSPENIEVVTKEENNRRMHDRVREGKIDHGGETGSGELSSTEVA